MPNPLSPWKNRRPLPGETCAVSAWGNEKRDALLFDRIYVRCLDPSKPPDIPIQLTFGIEEIDEELRRYEAMSSQGAAYDCPSDLLRHSEEMLQEQQYRKIGILATWTYSSLDGFLRGMSVGQKFAYEGALNNLPIVSHEDTSWEEIVSFKKDPESVRKYRDLRLWLLHGLKAESVGQATDVIGQKIENYRWALRKHGMKTRMGAFTQLFDWKQSSVTFAASGLAATVGGPTWGMLTSGLLFGTQVGAWAAQRRLEFVDMIRNEDREIAILYDAQEKFSSPSQNV